MKSTIKQIKQILCHWLKLSTYDLLLCCKWFNPLATIYLNFRSFPLKQAFHLPVYVYGRPHMYFLTGNMYVEGKIERGMIKFNCTAIGAPNNMSMQTDLLNQGKIIFHGGGFIGTGNKIRVSHNGILEFGEDFKIADQVNVGCYSKIKIGSHARVAHRCQILDSNYHYVANLNKRIIPQWKKPISIGDYCWLGNSSTITGGVTLPNYSIVGSNSLVNKDFSSIPMGSIIAGVPAKYIASGFRRVFNKKYEIEIDKYYTDNPNGLYIIDDEIYPEYISTI